LWVQYHQPRVKVYFNNPDQFVDRQPWWKHEISLEKVWNGSRIVGYLSGSLGIPSEEAVDRKRNKI